jgi:hypothetical protein
VSNLTNETAPKTGADLQALIDRAQKGDKTTLPALRAALKIPAVVDMLGGDLARHAQRTLIDKFSGKNLVFQESLRRKLEILRDELSGASPTPLERLLIEQVVACWLHLHHLEVVYADKDSMPLALGAYYQRSLTAAQKRYLAAIKTLAAVRRLALPVLQLNIARQQVNLAGGLAAPEPAADAAG